MHLPRDAELGKHRHPVKGVGKPGHDAVKVGVEQFVLGVPGAMVVPDGIRVLLFVDPDEAPFLFHADVARDQPVVANNGELRLQILEFRHGFGDQVVMRHRGHGQLQA